MDAYYCGGVGGLAFVALLAAGIIWFRGFRVPRCPRCRTTGQETGRPTGQEPVKVEYRCPQCGWVWTKGTWEFNL